MFNVISFVNNNSSETKSIITYIVCLFKFFISSRIRKLYMTSCCSFSNLILWMPRGGPHYSSLFFVLKIIFCLLNIWWGEIFILYEVFHVFCAICERISINYSIDHVFDFFSSSTCVYIPYIWHTNIIYMRKKSIKVGNKRYCKTNSFMGVCVRKLRKLWENVCVCARPP